MPAAPQVQPLSTSPQGLSGCSSHTHRDGSVGMSCKEVRTGLGELHIRAGLAPFEPSLGDGTIKRSAELIRCPASLQELCIDRSAIAHHRPQSRESHKLPALYLRVGGPMGDALDQDVQALKEWLGSAWRQLARPSMTRFDRRELRNYMRQAEAALQIAYKRVVARDNKRRDLFNAPDGSTPASPDLRILRILADSSGDAELVVRAAADSPSLPPASYSDWSPAARRRRACRLSSAISLPARGLSQSQMEPLKSQAV